MSRAKATRARPRTRMLAALLLIAGVVVGAGRADERTDPQTWQQVLQDYLRDPVRNRRAILALRSERQRLPPMFVLALGDAALRAGRQRQAVAYFSEVLERGADQPWAGWAELALGWIATLDDDLGTAHLHFAAVVDTAPQHAAAATLALGLVAGAEGNPRARELFDGVARDARFDGDTQQAARLGAAYARYWAGDYVGATAAFERAASGDPAGRFADDARYGAAWSLWQVGEYDAARARLEELAGEAVLPEAKSGASPGLVDLQARSLVRAGARRARRAPVRPPDQQILALLDGDGAQLARAALAWLATEPRVATSAPVVPSRVDTPAVAPNAAPPGAFATRAPVEEPGTGYRMPTAWLVGVVLLVVGFVAKHRRRRNPAHGSAHPRRGVA